MKEIFYAIGDVHGCDDLLQSLQARIVSDREQRHPDSPATIVTVGDYVDRGPDSGAVIDRLMRGFDGFEMVCLKGNHEAMLLACTQSDDWIVWRHWTGNGGDATLRSIGFDARHGAYRAVDLIDALGPERLAWLRGLPLYHETPDYLFVHAGIIPGRRIEDQSEKDLLWVRDRFLASHLDHGRLVIHGHTPVSEPEIRHNRIGIDTGAFMTGRLTAVVLGEEEGPRFLSVEEAS